MFNKSGLIAKSISVLASITLAIGLMPLPAFAASDNEGGSATAPETAMPLTAGTPIGNMGAQDAQEVTVSDWDALQQAVSSADDGQIIKLSNNIVNTGGNDRIKADRSGKSFTIDLAGHTLNRNLTSRKDNGHVIEVFGNTTLTITDSSATADNMGTGMITGGYSKRGGGIYVNEGATLIVESGTITGNTATEYGGGIYVKGTLRTTGTTIELPGTVTHLRNAIITNNTAHETGGGICVTSDGSIDLHYAAITSNTAHKTGGGISMSLKDNATIADCAIDSNIAGGDGGGLYMDAKGKTLAITNTSFGSNKSSGAAGGGLYLYYGTITMTGGAVYNNTAADDGGGAKITTKTTFKANNVTFSGNTATNKQGGGVENYGTTELTNCTFNNNSANKQGGGVFNDHDGSDTGILTLTNCAITENRSENSNGGGVYSDKKLTIAGGSITSNYAGSGTGHGIFIGKDSETTYLKGKVIVKDNGTEVSHQDIYLRTGTKLGFSESLDSNASIGVSMEDFNLDSLEGKAAIFTTGFSAKNSMAPDAVFFSPEGLDVTWDDSNEEAQIVSLWKDLQSKIDEAAENNTVLRLERDYTASPGTLFTIPADRVLEITKSVTIDLNGHTLNRNLSSVADSGHVFEVFSGATLTIEDGNTVKAGTITGGYSKWGGGIYVHEGATANLKGGAITGNTATKHGGGVYVEGTLNMKKDAYATGDGAAIAGNTSNGAGGGVYVADTGTLNLSDATIENNKASGNGGGIYMELGNDASITRCTIENNKAGKGGGLYMDAKGKTLAIADTEFNDNSASSDGGGIYLEWGTITMKRTGTQYSCSLDGNTAGGYGGGAMITNQTTLVANGVAIVENQATGDNGTGGGIANLGTTELVGCTISANNAKLFGGGVANGIGVLNDAFLHGQRIMTITGCTISANTASACGGGIYSDGELSIVGGDGGTQGNVSISGNSAGTSGGGIIIDLESKGTTIKGCILAENNTAPLGGDLFLEKNEKLTLAGKIDNTHIGRIDMEALGTFTSGYSDEYPWEDDPESVIPENDPSKFFSTAEGAIPAVWTADHTEAQLQSDWPTLQDAIDRAGDGGSVTLTKDYTASANDTALKVGAGKDVTIYLAGHTLNRSCLSSKDDGQVFLVSDGGYLTIYGGDASGADPGTGKITGGYAKRGGGIYVGKASTVKLYGGSITGNSASEDGGGIYVEGKLETFGGNISGNTAGKTGGGIRVAETGLIKLSSTDVKNNTASKTGGGIHAQLSADASIMGCSIAGNKADGDGGGLYLEADGKMLMISDVNICSNTSGGAGGGIYLCHGSIAMVSGLLEGNFATDGGGAKITSKTVFSANDVTVNNNVAETAEGGGIKNLGTTELTNCTINGNSAATQGGGIFNDKDGSGPGKLTLTSCAVTSNSAVGDGGGIYSDKTLTIADGSIGGKGLENSAYRGGGIYIDKYADTTSIQGELVVMDNTASAFGNNVYLRSGKTLTCAGALSGYAQLGIDLEDGVGVFTEDYTNSGTSAEPKDFFAVTKGYSVVLENGEAEIASDWATVKREIEGLADGDSYTLRADYAATPSDKRIEIDKNKAITVNLNGHTLNRNRMDKADSGHVFEVYGGSELTITDGKGGGTITGGYSKYGGGICVHENAILNLNDGIISGNRAEADGGGVYVDGTLNLNGGTIGANAAAGSGGGIHLGKKGTLNLAGGTVTGNAATGDGGGVMVESGATISVSGNPVVYGNRATKAGSDVYLPADNKLVIAATLDNDARIGVALAQGWGVFTIDYSIKNGNANPSQYFLSTEGYAIFAKDNEAEVGANTHGATDFEDSFLGWNEQVVTNPSTLSSYNWMSGISGDRYLHEINMPGTHDAGMNNIMSTGGLPDYTGVIPASPALIPSVAGKAAAEAAQMIAESFAKTQREYISQQLEEGARQFDIRLNDCKKELKWYGGYNWVDDGKNLWICHGTSKIGGSYLAVDDDNSFISFHDVLQVMKDFLKKHPTETVILHIRSQTNQDGHDDTIYHRALKILEQTVLEENPSTHEPYLYREPGSSSSFAPYKHMPQLKDCRGKIVLMPETQGFIDVVGGFKGNSFKDIAFTDPTHYKLTETEKVEEIEKAYAQLTGGEKKLLLSNADSVYDILWYWELNCTGEDQGYVKNYTLGDPPYIMADYVNPRLVGDTEVFGTERTGEYIGWVRLDSFDSYYAELIWRTNFFDELEYCTITVESGLNDPSYTAQIYQVLKGTTIQIPGNIYKNLPEDMYLDSWEAELPDGTTLTCAPGETLRIDEDVTFTAQWLDNGQVPVRILWSDANNADKLRESSVMFVVKKDSGDTQEITLTDGHDHPWSGAVPSNTINITPNWYRIDTSVEGGVDTEEQYRYTLAQHSGSGFTFTFYHTPSTEELITGAITWDDDDNVEGVRPSSVTIRLLENGIELEDVSITADNGWKYNFGQRKQYRDGKDIEYSVAEDPIVDENDNALYAIFADGFSFTNIHLRSGQSTTNVMGVVNWDDLSDVRGERPKSITVHLFENGVEEISSQKVAANESGFWGFCFDGVPMSDVEGQPIIYDIAVDEISGYVTTVEPQDEYGYLFGITEALDIDPADKKPSEVTRDPEPHELTYEDDVQTLVKEGSCTGGTMMYALGENDQTAPELENFGTALPAQTNAGTYYVWYYVKGDTFHTDVAPACVTATIAKLPASFTGASATEDYASSEFQITEVEAEGLLQGHTHNVTFTAKGTNAGTYQGTMTALSDVSIKSGEGDEAIDVTANYEITLTPGTLTINPIEATITVNNASKVRGEADPVFTGTVKGLVKSGDLGEIAYVRTNNDEVAGTYKGVLTATYPVTVNYNVTVKPGDFTIEELYTVKWLNSDGSVLQSKDYTADDPVPTYDGKTPTKEATAQYTYAFASWDGGTVDGTVTTYKPTFNKTVNTYTVKFVNADGTVLQSGKVAYGETPKYAGKTPTKAATAQYTYAFTGWDKGVAKVTGNATYTATFKATVNTYTVKFVNADGAVLQSGKVAYGQTPTYTGKTPTKAATAKRVYTFKGWSPAVKSVTGNATYKATYSSKARKYERPMASMAADGELGITISWNEVPGADGYDVFFARCNHGGKKVVMRKAATVKAGDVLSLTKDNLRPKTSYKARVKAFVMQGKEKIYVKSSPLLHFFTSGGTKKYTNAKSVSVNKTKVSLAAGEAFRLTARVSKQKAGKKLMPKAHVATVRYLSSDKKVAIVSKTGKIRGVGAGTCYVYVYAHSGVYKKVKVTVG